MLTGCSDKPISNDPVKCPAVEKAIVGEDISNQPHISQYKTTNQILQGAFLIYCNRYGPQQCINMAKVCDASNVMAHVTKTEHVPDDNEYM